MFNVYIGHLLQQRHESKKFSNFELTSLEHNLRFYTESLKLGLFLNL